ncbi:IclR family transcriptional regulator [bacterium]|nr:MAG: IclR family transcriptional regulator [bacterium]
MTRRWARQPEGDWVPLAFVADVDVAKPTQGANGDSAAGIELVPTQHAHLRARTGLLELGGVVTVSLTPGCGCGIMPYSGTSSQFKAGSLVTLASAGSGTPDRRRRPSPVGLALDVLLTVAGPKQPMTVRELSNHLGWPRSSVHRAMAVLESYGLLVKDQASQLYQLGPRVLMLASGFLSRHDLVSLGTPVANSLRDRLDETTSLQVRVGVRRVPIVIAECSHELRHVLRAGGSYPLFAGAAGKVLVAFGGIPGLAEAVFEDASRHPEEFSRRFDLGVYMEELALIRQKGYATSWNERVQGSVGVAAPVFNSRGQLLGALAVHGPTVRVTQELLNSSIPAVLETAQALSALATNVSPPLGDHFKSSHMSGNQSLGPSIPLQSKPRPRQPSAPRRRPRRKEVQG